MIATATSACGTVELRTLRRQAPSRRRVFFDEKDMAGPWRRHTVHAFCSGNERVSDGRQNLRVRCASARHVASGFLLKRQSPLVTYLPNVASSHSSRVSADREDQLVEGSDDDGLSYVAVRAPWWRRADEPGDSSRASAAWNTRMRETGLSERRLNDVAREIGGTDAAGRSTHDGDRTRISSDRNLRSCTTASWRRARARTAQRAVFGAMASL